MLQIIIILALAVFCFSPFILSLVYERSIKKMNKEKFVEKASDYIRQKDLVSLTGFIRKHISCYVLNNQYIVERLTAVAAEVDGAQKVDSADNK